MSILSDEIRAQANKFIRKRKREDHSFTKADLVHEFATWLRENPDRMNPHELAAKIVDALDDSNRPKPKPDTKDLFGFGEGWVPTGGGRRIELRDAGEDDIRSWFTIEMGQFGAQAAAYAEKSKKLNSVLKEFQKHKRAKTVGELWELSKDTLSPVPAE